MARRIALGAARALLVASSVAFTLGVAELALRFVFPLGGMIYRLDPEYFQEHIPDSGKIFVHKFVNGGHLIPVHINSLGFRGPETQKKKSVPRVIVYGDSFAVGEYSFVERSFSGQLEARLSELAHSRVEVLNAGIVGFGPDQVALRMQRDLPLYEPDLVVLAVFAGNDFGDLIRNKLFRIDESGQLQRGRPSPVDDLAREVDLSGIKSLALGRLVVKASRSIPRRLADWQKEPAEPQRGEQEFGASAPDFFEIQLAIAEREYAEYQSMPDRVTNLFNDGYDADVALVPNSTAARYKRALMTAVLGLIARTAAGYDVGLIAVLIPSPHDLIEGYEGATVNRRRWPDYHPGNLSDALVEASRRNRIPYVDLQGLFVLADPASLYFRGDNHWNESGQALAARLVAAAVSEAELLSAARGASAEAGVGRLEP